MRIIKIHIDQFTRFYDNHENESNILAVCSSGCNGRGTCVAPEQCRCYNSDQYTGYACQTRKMNKTSLIYLTSYI